MKAPEDPRHPGPRGRAEPTRAPRRPLIPGLGLALGVSLLVLGAFVVLPLGVLVLRAASLGPAGLVETYAAPRVRAALGLSFGAAALAAAINVGFGLPVAWVLVRYRFPGRRLLDALVDLPFALPTAVAGLALTAIYSRHGWIGRPVAEHLGLELAFAPPGVVLALVFVGHPFVVRTLQPVIASLDPEQEEAARSLGAGPWQTFRKVQLPELRPAIAAGAILAFARGLGEYGSVVFVSGNLPGRTEIAPLLVVSRLESHDEAGAAAVGVVLVGTALAAMTALHLAERALLRRGGRR